MFNHPLSSEAIQAYSGTRPDLQRLVPLSAKAILDVGCGAGAMGMVLSQRQGCRIEGIEPHPDLSQLAYSRLHRVYTSSVELAFEVIRREGTSYDTIIFADVLEHLIDPWSILKEATSLLRPNGLVLASIPNVRHYDTIYNLLVKGVWPIRETGIHDRTHLRFFTKRDILKLFASAGLLVNSVDANYRLVERNHPINRWSDRLAVWPLKEFLVFQYLVVGSLD